jgi:hypothetical protein
MSITPSNVHTYGGFGQYPNRSLQDQYRFRVVLAFSSKRLRATRSTFSIPDRTSLKRCAYGTPKEKTAHMCAVFSLGVPIGNRTRIAGTTNLSVNRYTIGTILDYCDYDITRRRVMRTAALARGRPSLCAGEDLNLHTIAGTTTSR